MSLAVNYAASDAAIDIYTDRYLDCSADCSVDCCADCAADAYLVDLPERLRRDDRPLAQVVTLRAPGRQSIAAPLRLTRRGVVVLTAAVVAVAVALVIVARLSAPSTPASSAGPASVTVRAGDTLWSIAGRVAPQRDPRAEVALLRRVNHLTGVAIAPGQVLQTR